MLETTTRNQNRSLNRAEMIACDLQFTSSEVNNYIKHHCKKDKAPGLSGFTNEFFITFQNELSGIIADIMNEMR